MLAEGSRLFDPPPVFARCRGSFLADWSLENAPFYPQKSPMSLKTKDSKKRKFLRFMKGNGQRRLLGKGSELWNPLPVFCLARYFPRAAGASANAATGSVEEAVGGVAFRLIRHGYL